MGKGKTTKSNSKELSEMQRLKAENQKLKRQLNRLRKQMSRVDLDNYDNLKEVLEAQKIESLIEELYPDGLSETQLNDILWFEADWIYESLGIYED